MEAEEKRIAQIKKDYEAEQKEFHLEELKNREREIQIAKENSPELAAQDDTEATASEFGVPDDSVDLEKTLEKTPFSWTSEAEEKLEEILISCCFDFELATKKFAQEMNKAAAKEGKVYTLTEKNVQLRWTDIEIRKYRLNDAAQGYVAETPSAPKTEPKTEPSQEERRTYMNVIDTQRDDKLEADEEIDTSDLKCTDFDELD